MLYRRKKHLINSHILNLTFSLVISDDFSKEQAIISNVKAFESLLGELEVIITEFCEFNKLRICIFN
jgi:hypothetical protein